MAITYRDVPDRKFYLNELPIGDAPIFSPWEYYGEFGKLFLGSGANKGRRVDCYYMHELAVQAFALEKGEIWEAGVWRGDTAVFLSALAKDYCVELRLFDTFEGMPETDPSRDLHKAGDFADTSLDLVKERIAKTKNDNVDFRPGLVPDTYAGLENARITLAHIDLDIYHPIKSSCEFIYPRLARGGAMVFDDYGWMSCPGARGAVDEFFADKPERPIVLHTRQAVVVKI